MSIGASVGIAIRPEHGTTLTDLMRAADTAMYHARANGRGCAEHFTERVPLESDLRRAVERDQFTLVYQPQISAIDGSIVAAEALLRWQHPEHGLCLPGTFIGRAEETRADRRDR